MLDRSDERPEMYADFEDHGVAFLQHCYEEGVHGNSRLWGVIVDFLAYRERQGGGLTSWQAVALSELSRAASIISEEESSFSDPQTWEVVGAIADLERKIIHMGGTKAYADQGYCPYCEQWFDEGCVDEAHQEAVAAMKGEN